MFGIGWLSTTFICLALLIALHEPTDVPAAG